MREVLTRDKAAQSLRPGVGSAQRIAQELRSSKQVKRKENRYRVVASHRPGCSDPAAPAINGEASTAGNRADSETKEGASQEESGAVDDSSDCWGKFQLFDIEQEEEAVGDSGVTAANPQVSKPAWGAWGTLVSLSAGTCGQTDCVEVFLHCKYSGVSSQL